MFRESIADITEVSVAAVIVVAIDSSGKRRKLLALADQLFVDLVIEASDDFSASTILHSLKTTSNGEFVSKLEHFGLRGVSVEISQSSLLIALPPPPPTESSNSRSKSTVIATVVALVSIPSITFALMSCFAKAALRNILVKCGPPGRRLADFVVPDFRSDLKDHKEEVAEFMRTHQLPRLVDTTPLLDENALKVDSSNLLGRGGFSTVFRGELRRKDTDKACVAVKCYSFTSPQDSTSDANGNISIPESVKR